MCVCAVSHHLSKDFGVFGPGEASVGDPARHQPLVRVGPRPLHLRHHCLLLFLLGGKKKTQTLVSFSCAGHIYTSIKDGKKISNSLQKSD